jgi:hypothetical protein
VPVPGTTALTFPNELLSLRTVEHLALRSGMKDTEYRFVDDALAKGRVKIEGGDRLIIPFELEDHSTPTEVTGGGYQSWNNFVQTTHSPGSETFAYVVQPAMISGKEKKQFTSLIKGVTEALGRVDNVKRHLKRQAQKAWLQGAVASGTLTGVPKWTSWLSVNGIDNNTHILEELASGTNTLHNLAKASFPATSHPQLHNVVADVGGNISANLLLALSLAKHRAASRGNPMGKEHTWYVRLTLAQGLETVYRTREWYAPGQKLDEAGQFDAMIMGSPLISLPEIASLPGAAGATTVTDPLSGIGVAWGADRGLALHLFDGCAFDFDDWMDIPGTIGVQASLCHVFGQLVSGKRPGMNIAIIDAEA